MISIEERVEQTAEVLGRRIGARQPRVAMVLGSGLSSDAFALENPLSVPLEDLLHVPRPSVAGHGGQWTFGKIAGVEVVIAGGRVHGYEGVELAVATLGIRVMARLGCEILVLTNAAGGIRDDLQPGTLMRITDHINLLGSSPLLGPHVESWGERFPDMSAVYDPELGRSAESVARAVDATLATGVYAAMLGPQYETPAEIRFLRNAGADAVGMSTVPEAIVGRQSGLRILGVSLISNRAAGLTAGHVLSHEEVLEAGRLAGGKLSAILTGVLAGL